MHLVNWEKADKCGTCGAPLVYTMDDLEGLHGLYCSGDDTHTAHQAEIGSCPFCGYSLESDLDVGDGGTTIVVEICPNPYCYHHFTIRTPQEEKLPDLDDLEPSDLEDSCQ